MWKQRPESKCWQQSKSEITAAWTKAVAMGAVKKVINFKNILRSRINSIC